MEAFGEDVHLGMHLVPGQGHRHFQGVLHRDNGIVKGRPQEGGRAVGTHLVQQPQRLVRFGVHLARHVLEALAAAVFAGDDGVAEHRAVGFHVLRGEAERLPQLRLLPHGGDGSGQMTAC